MQNTEEDQAKFLSETFAAAPYVHPFRHPSFHATQLQALMFAKQTKRRLLWVVAHDVLSDKTQASRSAEKEELRKEHWLEFNDRVTAGIPGLLPLVLNLPIRFTEAINKHSRELGVYKHSRGWLRGWALPEDEEARLQGLDDPEIVLKKRPMKLLIEVASATKSMPLIDGKKSTSCWCKENNGL